MDCGEVAFRFCGAERRLGLLPSRFLCRLAGKGEFDFLDARQQGLGKGSYQLSELIVSEFFALRRQCLSWQVADVF